MSDTNTQSSASGVGNRFVLHYYTVLHTQPKDLQNLYKENSSFTHGYEDGTEETVYGKEEIGKKIKALEFEDCKVTLSVVDCQPSINGGVLVMVIGFLSNKGEEPKRFVETFFLAVQEPAGYYVANDVFRYVQDASEQSSELSHEEPVSHHEATASEVKEEKVTPPPSSAEKEKPAVPAPTTTAAAVPASKPQQQQQKKEEVAAPQQQKEKPVQQPQQQQQQTKEQQPQQTQTQQQNKPAPQQQKTGGQPPVKGAAPPTKPANWAAVVKSNENNNAAPVPSSTATTTTTTTTTTTSSTSNAEEQQQHQPATATTKPAAVKEQQQQQAQKSPAVGKYDVPALYVNNLPFDIAESEVRTQFAHYGEIKHIDHRAAKGYCFIEYTDPTIVPQTIAQCKVSPVTMGGRVLSVEERKPKAGGGGKQSNSNNKDNNNTANKDNKKPRGNREVGKEKRVGSPSNSQKSGGQPQQQGGQPQQQQQPKQQQQQKEKQPRPANPKSTSH